MSFKRPLTVVMKDSRNKQHNCLCSFVALARVWARWVSAANSSATTRSVFHQEKVSNMFVGFLKRRSVLGNTFFVSARRQKDERNVSVSLRSVNSIRELWSIDDENNTLSIGWTEIYCAAFELMNGLTSEQLPKKVSRIFLSTALGCSSLKEQRAGDSAGQWKIASPQLWG